MIASSKKKIEVEGNGEEARSEQRINRFFSLMYRFYKNHTLWIYGLFLGIAIVLLIYLLLKLIDESTKAGQKSGNSSDIITTLTNQHRVNELAKTKHNRPNTSKRKDSSDSIVSNVTLEMELVVNILAYDEAERYCSQQNSRLAYIDNYEVEEFFEQSFLILNKSLECDLALVGYREMDDVEDHYSDDDEYLGESLPITDEFQCYEIDMMDIQPMVKKIDCFSPNFDCYLCESVQNCQWFIPPCYYPRRASLTIDKAHNECKAEFGGHLADISTLEEWKVVLKKLLDEENAKQCQHMLLGRGQMFRDFETSKGLHLPVISTIHADFLYGSQMDHCLVIDTSNGYKLTPYPCQAPACFLCRTCKHECTDESLQATESY